MRWSEDEEGKVTLPKEGAGKRSVGEGSTTRTEKKVQREETESKGGGDGMREFAKEGSDHS